MRLLPSLLIVWFFISGKGTVLGVLRALNNFATTKINFAELFACEVTFLHMSVNCKEEKLTLSRKKVIFMGSILEQKIFQLPLFPIFKVGLANYNFFIFFQEINVFLTILTPNF